MAEKTNTQPVGETIETPVREKGQDYTTRATDQKEHGKTLGTVMVPKQNIKGHTMMPGELAHLKSLISRAKNTESNQHKWEFIAKAQSTCGTTIVFSLGLIASDTFDEGFKLIQWISTACWIGIVVSSLCLIVLSKINKLKKEEWKKNTTSFLEEAISLIPNNDE